MKKTLYITAILFAALSASAAVSAAPAVDDSKIIAVYPADTQRVGSEDLVRVETVKSRNAVSNTKVYVRKDDVPAELLAATPLK